MNLGFLLFIATLAGGSIEERVARARNGDSKAREELLRDYTPFILKTASRAVKRYLVVGKDEEVSVSLQAFDEAVSAYSSPRPGFLAFAATVIRRRLIDYYRRERRRDEVPFSSLADEDGSPDWPVAVDSVRASVTEDWDLVLERRDDIEEWKESLKEFSLTLKDVVKAAPKHEDARQRAIRTAALLAADADLLERFLEQRRLPVEELARRLPEEVASRKTLERQRAYITAVALILARDLTSLKGFLNLDEVAARGR